MRKRDEIMTRTKIHLEQKSYIQNDFIKYTVIIRNPNNPISTYKEVPKITSEGKD